MTITPDDEGRESTGLVVQHSFSGDLQSCCSFRVLLAMGAQCNLILHQMDVSTAFLKGELFEANLKGLLSQKKRSRLSVEAQCVWSKAVSTLLESCS